MTIVIIIIAVVILLAVGWMAFSKRRATEFDQRRDAASAHRDEAAERSRGAEQAGLAAQEQSARAERERLEAQEQAERAERERAAATQHETQAREIDPDVDN